METDARVGSGGLYSLEGDGFFVRYGEVVYSFGGEGGRVGDRVFYLFDDVVEVFLFVLVFGFERREFMGLRVRRVTGKSGRSWVVSGGF